MKLYIAVIDTFPDYMTPTLVAHATLGAHIEFSRQYIANETGICKDYPKWLVESFKKCVVRVNQKEFDKICELPGIYKAFEKHTLGGSISCIVVCPREENPKVLKFAKLWKPLEK